MFLSRELKPAEKNYWPTELEAGGLIWAIHKLSYIIQGSKVTVYTDHKASEAIVKMTTLHTTSPGHANLCLANWSLLLSQYWHNLDVIYVRGIENVMADALSHLHLEIISLSNDIIHARNLHQQLDDIDEVAARDGNEPSEPSDEQDFTS